MLILSHQSSFSLLQWYEDYYRCYISVNLFFHLFIHRKFNFLLNCPSIIVIKILLIVFNNDNVNNFFIINSPILFHINLTLAILLQIDEKT